MDFRHWHLRKKCSSRDFEILYDYESQEGIKPRSFNMELIRDILYTIFHMLYFSTDEIWEWEQRKSSEIIRLKWLGQSPILKNDWFSHPCQSRFSDRQPEVTELDSHLWTQWFQNDVTWDAPGVARLLWHMPVIYQNFVDFSEGRAISLSDWPFY